MIHVIGSRGRLGRALCASRPPEEIVALDREVYENWWQDDAGASIGRYFRTAAPGSVVLIAAGLLDPALPGAAHRRVNVELPVRVIRGACAAGLRVVTFGTVMEQLVEHPNAYIASKAELGRFVAERAAAGDAVMHVRLHTLYGGGPPAPFMFLGQLCSALREGRPFEMSPGRQLREYHHVDDDVTAIHLLCAAGTRGVTSLNHGEPCTLRELASCIFASMGRTDLLRIGARDEPSDDNFATVLRRPAALQHMQFRPTLQAVTAYVQAVLTAPTDRR
jgi:nucleoside-diphosphate-sugar epimerase